MGVSIHQFPTYIENITRDYNHVFRGSSTQRYYNKRVYLEANKTTDEMLVKNDVAFEREDML